MKIIKREKPRVPFLISLLILILFLPVAYYLTTHPFKTQAAWFNDQWGYRKEIPVTAHTSAETNVYLNLTGAAALDTSDTTKFQTDCGDLRFTDARGEALKYYLVSGCGTATTVIHVLIPNFPAGAQTFYYYYGNPTVGNSTEPADFSTAASGVTIGSFGTEEKSPAPVAYWKLDEGYGTSAFDATGHGFTGTLTNSPTWLAEELCVAGKCLNFDGSASDRHVNIAHNSSINFAASDNFSIALWERIPVTQVDTVSTQNMLMEKWTCCTGGYPYVIRIWNQTHANNGKISACRYDGTNNPCIDSVKLVNDNAWHYIEFVKNGATLYLYIDGVLDNTASDTTTGTTTNTAPLYVGIRNGADNPLTGALDDVKIYNYSRSAAQVKTDYNAGKAHAATAKGSSVSFSNRDNNDALSNGLVGYWKMDETSGNAADSSGNSYTLTNNNIATFVSGKFGNAASLNGTTQSFSTSTNIGRVQTISFWVNPTSSTTYMVDLDGTKTITATSGTIAANNFADSTIYINGVAGTTLTANVWQLVTVTTNNFVTTSALSVGKVGSNYLSGNIDEVRLYNRALSPAEVASLYNWAPGPVGYWKFDENTGQSANDTSGSGYTGTLGATSSPGSDDPTWSVGKIGQALSFDGNDRVDVGDNLDFSGDFTLEAWFKSTGGDGTSPMIINKAATAGSLGYALTIADTPNTLRFVVYNTVNSGWLETYSTTVVMADNLWHHAEGVISGSTAYLYLDGKLEATDNTTSGTRVTNSPDQLQIGHRSTTNYFVGLIDNVRLYNYARTPKQVVEDMNAGHPAPGSPVGSYVARWKFDDLSGTTAQDTTSNNNDLTLSAASWTTNGKFTGAWNGTNAVWLSRADDADFDFAATEDFSTSLWFKSDSTTNPTATEYLVNKASSIIQGYAVYANTSGQICFAIDDDVAWDPDVSSCTTDDFYDGLWHQVLAVRDTTADTLAIYVDGILRDSDTDTTSATLANSLSLFIGDRDGVDNGDEFASDLDEIKFFRSALTTDQIKLDFNQGSSQVLGSLSTASDGTTASNSAERSYCVPGDTGTCSAPVGEWKFEEGSGASANDTSGNGQTGTITGATFSAGKVGKSLNFNGGTDTVSSIGSISGIKTVEFWINPTSTTANIIDINTTGPAYISASAGTISATGFTSATIYVNGVVSSTLTANIWQFVTVTTDTGLLGSAIQLGRANGTSLTGKLDQVRLYDSARTPAQIAWDYNRGSPLARWKFDECQGTTAYNAAPNANGTAAGMNGTIAAGASGNTAVGTCTTSATTMWYNGRTGKFNSALDFDGTDDNITVASTATLQITGDITVSAWINMASFTDNDYIYAHSTDGETSATNNLYSLRWNTASGNDLLYEHENGAGVDTVNTFDTNLSAGAWYNIVTVRNATTNTIKIYVNGTQQDSTYTYTNDPDGGTSGYLTIGARNALDTSLGFVDGLIDDVQIYSYALSPVQIKSLYNDGAVRYGPTTGNP